MPDDKLCPLFRKPVSEVCHLCNWYHYKKCDITSLQQSVFFMKPFKKKKEYSGGDDENYD